MPCKCDPSKKRQTECRCNDAPPLPGGSPLRALNRATCPRGSECGSGVPIRTPETSTERSSPIPYNPSVRPRGRKNDQASNLAADKKRCVSLEPRRRAPCAGQVAPRPVGPTCPAKEPPPTPRKPPCMRENVQGEKKPLKRRPVKKTCSTAGEAAIPCGADPEEERDATREGVPQRGKICALEKTLSKTQWQDEEGYHSASVTMSQLYRPDDQSTGGGGKSCASDAHRNYLKAKLKALMGEIKPIPESSLPDGTESKPEPEMVAAALLMSESEGTDLGRMRPDNVFDKLFSSSSPERAIAIASAAPEPMSDVVVPVEVRGRKAPSLDIPNIEKVVQKAKGAAAPNPNAFQQSSVYDSFNATMNERIAGSPPNADIAGYLGASPEQTPGNGPEEGIMEYVIKPQPPPYRNRIQLNGSVKPGWFPGFAVVSPELPGYVKLSSDAGEALREAWRLCRPRHFDELSKSLVNTG